MGHPLEKHLYCPLCGSPSFHTASFKSRKCGNCGFEMFMNPSSACVAVIVKDGGLLAVRRKYPPAEGTLDLPGGFADIGETAEESVSRELLEETGLRAESIHYLFSLPNLYHYSGIDIPTQDLFFACTVADTAALSAHDDASECLWIPLAQVRPLDFGLQSVRRGVERFLSATHFADGQPFVDGQEGQKT